jgi:hypothetical protein
MSISPTPHDAEEIARLQTINAIYNAMRIEGVFQHLKQPELNQIKLQYSYSTFDDKSKLYIQGVVHVKISIDVKYHTSKDNTIQ